jgi:hypothetical protein
METGGNTRDSRAIKAWRWITGWLRALAGPLIITVTLTFGLSRMTRLGFWTTFFVILVSLLLVALLSALADED